ncbi:hypothetical protein P9619_gp01 [Escherichia phage bob]|uniref:Uncharacterized protein n=1 Tax=Escherichia phage bob TaxID=2696386 RepID=A0A6C0R0B1_9CAUD|nr:hypothetical protein P9619_gp01 [Escherichia phage bob]QHZ59610.1 hypothetical protein bob_1 [Escherichia phage bob]
MKHCGRCNTDKDGSAFNKGQSWCAKCMAAYKKERRDKERGAPPRVVWREYTGEIVTCRTCGERKRLTPENFRPGNQASQSHIRKECRSCANKSRREYNHRTPEIRAYYKLFQYRKADERKGLNTDLTTEDVLRLTSLPCAYCGSTGDNGAAENDEIRIVIRLERGKTITALVTPENLALALTGRSDIPVDLRLRNVELQTK